MKNWDSEKFKEFLYWTIWEDIIKYPYYKILRVYRNIKWYFDRKYYIKNFVIGAIAERCDYHFGPITKIDVDKNYIMIRSIFTGEEAGCSVTLCGVRIISPKEQELLIQIYNESGIAGICKHHALNNGATEEEYEASLEEERKIEEARETYRQKDKLK